MISYSRNENAKYPGSEYFYAPSDRFPEYSYEYIDDENYKNDVYALIRESFINLGLDKEHVGLKEWNPLGEYIKSGDTVLIKPNWVMDFNPEEKYHDMECLITHPSVIRTVIDYVALALHGSGRIVVADAPMVECDFDNLFKLCHFKELKDYYLEKGVQVEFIDMRGIIRPHNLNKIEGDKMVKDSFDEAVYVDIGAMSAFEELSDSQIGNLRALNNNPEAIKKNHYRGKHGYMINKNILEADVIINCPKPKSHRKAGLTACAKNFVGANARKEYLPHANISDSQSGGGDAYDGKNFFYEMYYKFNDIYWSKHAKGSNAFFWRLMYGIFRRLGVLTSEPFLDGSWYKNNTIWRTICDLNKAVKYCDAKGTLHKEPQRKIFNICDMVISGEGEGPLAPSPKNEGVIVSGEEIFEVDRFICRFFGFNEKYVQYIAYMYKENKMQAKDMVATSNGVLALEEFDFDEKCYLKAGKGWHGVIDAR